MENLNEKIAVLLKFPFVTQRPTLQETQLFRVKFPDLPEMAPIDFQQKLKVYEPYGTHL